MLTRGIMSVSIIKGCGSRDLRTVVKERLSKLNPGTKFFNRVSTRVTNSHGRRKGTTGYRVGT